MEKPLTQFSVLLRVVSGIFAQLVEHLEGECILIAVDIPVGEVELLLGRVSAAHIGIVGIALNRQIGVHVSVPFAVEEAFFPMRASGLDDQDFARLDDRFSFGVCYPISPLDLEKDLGPLAYGEIFVGRGGIGNDFENLLAPVCLVDAVPEQFFEVGKCPHLSRANIPDAPIC